MASPFPSARAPQRGLRRADEAGVSTLGILLLVGISMTVAAAPMVMLKLDQGGKDPVVSGVQSKIAAGPGGWNEGDEYVEIAHRAGRIMEAEFVEVVITVDGQATVVKGTEGSPDGSSFATPGAPWRYAVQIPEGAEVHVEVHWEKLMTEQLVAEDTLVAPGATPSGGGGGGAGGGGDDGDAEGADAGGDEDGQTVTICHIPPGNPDAHHNLEVGQSALDDHLGHGDHLGACADGDDGGDGDAGDDDQGDDDHGDGHDDDGDEGDNGDDGDADDQGGDGDDDGYVVCHIPPGNPDNAHTITVGSQNAVNAHLGHGDHIGHC